MPFMLNGASPEDIKITVPWLWCLISTLPAHLRPTQQAWLRSFLCLIDVSHCYPPLHFSSFFVKLCDNYRLISHIDLLYVLFPYSLSLFLLYFIFFLSCIAFLPPLSSLSFPPHTPYLAPFLPPSSLFSLNPTQV